MSGSLVEMPSTLTGFTGLCGILVFPPVTSASFAGTAAFVQL
jgi:hypothetical protein